MAFAINLIITLLFIMVLVKPHDVYIRKLIFYLVTALQMIGAVFLVAVFIYLCATDQWVEDACRNGTDDYETYSQCLDYAKTYMIAAMVIVFVVGGLLAFCTLQILYYGWKEQQAIA